MNIFISTLGSRGDTQPYLALAAGLQQAGHRVTLAAPQRFREWIQSYGVVAYPLRHDPLAVLQAFGKTGNPIRTLFAITRVLNAGVLEAMEDSWQAAQAADFLIQTGTGVNALEAAALRGIPVAFAYLAPMAPTHAFPMFLLPFRFSPGRSYNYLTHILARQILWTSMNGPVINRWRARLGLTRWRSEAHMRQYARGLGAPSIYGFSPSILPRPVDWEESQHITGYWFLEPLKSWQPAQDLLRFLESGPPPVYVGFGSMSPDNSEHLTRLALRALELSGQRGVLLTGWGGLRRLPAPQNVFFVDDVPHAWLFPRMAAVVHHGGAGTTAAGLHAGVPGILAPFGGDQNAWADLVVKSGLGPPVGAAQRLTPEKLAGAIRTALDDPAMRARARAIGDKIRAENGIARAVEVIERYSRVMS